MHLKRHLAYGRYVARHKWFLLRAGRHLGLQWLACLLHDCSKLRPDEWGPYARCFYGRDGSGRYRESAEFKAAWLRHQRRNPHHWQYWVLLMDSGKQVSLEMPRRYLIEMVADWQAASRAITGRWEARSWYRRNAEKMQLHPATRAELEALLRSCRLR